MHLRDQALNIDILGDWGCLKGQQLLTFKERAEKQVERPASRAAEEIVAGNE